MRKAMRIYLILTLVGVILVGLGCGISVFEMSTYQTADYSAADADASLPAIEMSTKTLEAPFLFENSQRGLFRQQSAAHSGHAADERDAGQKF